MENEIMSIFWMQIVIVCFFVVSAIIYAAVIIKIKLQIHENIKQIKDMLESKNV